LLFIQEIFRIEMELYQFLKELLTFLT